MRHRILVVDDEAADRQSVYERVAAQCGSDLLSRNFSIEFVFAKQFWEIPSLLKQEHFSAVILDIVLTGWHRSPTDPTTPRATEVLAFFDDDIPVALLSSHWTSVEVRELIREWPKKNCSMFILWDDLQTDAGKDSIERTLLTLRRLIENY